MISRILVSPKGKDVREKIFLDSFEKIGLSRNPSSVSLHDSYLISSELPPKSILKAAEALTNSVIEEFSIDTIKAVKKANYALEIGFLPGVTDNLGNTARETIFDLFHLKGIHDLKVYSSKIFLISGNISRSDIEKIAFSLHNPLIERAEILKIKGRISLPLKIPEVVLEKHLPVMHVSLDVSDEELVKIGKEGIKDEKGGRRGPLALDLESMKTIQKYFQKLNRDPTDIELESLAQTWSEHCKHTIFTDEIDGIKDGLLKTYIKDATNKIRKNKAKKDFCVSVFSDNSGGIIFDDEFLITHKVETHNSPSALDPFGGAITGIVGVNRDSIGFGLGAKPVANTYGFCFGYPEDKKKLYRDQEKKQKMLLPKRIMEGVIKGVNSGGNCSGIPTISGFVRYDDRFRGKPLVFVGTVGLIPRKIDGKYSHQKKAKKGEYIVMVGGKVGADGIHGATFSSGTMDAYSPATAVQIGDPITQKKLSDAIIKEARDKCLYTSITDNGAGGLSCSVAEMAKESGGAVVFLEKAPLKYPGLLPWQIWVSESQERMTLSIPKNKWKDFKKLMTKRGVEAWIIGEFTSSGRCIVKYKRKTIMDIDMKFLHDGLPKRSLKTKETVRVFKKPPAKRISENKILEILLAEKNIAGFSFISRQYDHEVQSSSVIKPLSGRGGINTDAQVFRPVLKSAKGAVLSYGLYPSYGDISPYHMAACALDTAVRNNVAAGGSLSSLAILDNFCWCSSNEEGRLYELKEALKACHKYAIGYQTPFISGKDSMFNDFKGYDETGNPIKISIPPTILISSISVIPDVRKAVSPEFKNDGDIIYILGRTFDELGASEYYKLLAAKFSKNKNFYNKSNYIGSDVPKVNLWENLKVYKALERAIDKEIISSAMSLSSGGLAISLAKASIGGMLGCEVELSRIPGEISRTDALLFSESQGRILVSIRPENVLLFEKIAKNIPFKKIGRVLKNRKFEIFCKGKSIIRNEVERLLRIYHKFSEEMS